MMNKLNASTLIAAIACTANGLAIKTNLESSASATATYTSISENDELLLQTGESMDIEFAEWSFRFNEGQSSSGVWIDKFELKLQDDGNLVLYRHSAVGTKAIWASDTTFKGHNLKLWL